MTKNIITTLLIIISMIFIIENFNTEVIIKLFSYQLIKVNMAIVILLSILIGFTLGIAPNLKKLNYKKKEKSTKNQENNSG